MRLGELGTYMRAVAILVLALSACDAVDMANPLRGAVRGPCTLELVGDDGRSLEAPYGVTMQTHAGASPSAVVMMEGSGWSGMVEIRTRMPSGELERASTEAPSFNDGQTGKVFEEPGSWVVEIQDAKCLGRVEVDVRPPGG